MKIWILLIGILALIIGVYFYLEYDMLGFPDGYLSPRDAAKKVLYLSYAGLAAALFIRSMLIILYPKGLIDKRKMLTLLVPLFLFLIFILLIDQFYLQGLEHGGGA